MLGMGFALLRARDFANANPNHRMVANLVLSFLVGKSL